MCFCNGWDTETCRSTESCRNGLNFINDGQRWQPLAVKREFQQSGICCGSIAPRGCFWYNAQCETHLQSAWLQDTVRTLPARYIANNRISRCKYSQKPDSATHFSCGDSATFSPPSGASIARLGRGRQQKARAWWLRRGRPGGSRAGQSGNSPPTLYQISAGSARHRTTTIFSRLWRRCFSWQSWRPTTSTESNAT